MESKVVSDAKAHLEVALRLISDDASVARDPIVSALIKELYRRGVGEPNPAPWMVAGIARTLQAQNGTPRQQRPAEAKQQAAKQTPAKAKAKGAKQQPKKQASAEEGSILNLKNIGKRKGITFSDVDLNLSQEYYRRGHKAWEEFVAKGRNTYGLVWGKSPAMDCIYVADDELYQQIQTWANGLPEEAKRDNGYRPAVSQKLKTLMETATEQLNTVEAAEEGKSNT